MCLPTLLLLFAAAVLPSAHFVAAFGGAVQLQAYDVNVLLRQATPEFSGANPSAWALRHEFAALDAPAKVSQQCTAFGVAWMALNASCPSVAQFAAGKITQDQFLSTFCSSGCSAQVSALFTSYAECIPGQTAAAVADLTAECDKRPECYSSSVQSQFIAVRDQCYLPLTNLTNISSAAQTAVAQACGADCLSRITALATSYPQCLGAAGSNTSASTFVSFVNFMCSKPAGVNDTCAWNLRSLGRINCDANCGQPGSWCSKSDGSGCNLRANNTVLTQMCTPCLSGLATYVSVLGSDANAFGSLIGLYCMKADPTKASSNFCMPITSSSFGDPSDDGNCNGDVGRCLSRYGRLLATITVSNAASTFASCMRAPYGRLSLCQPPYEAAFNTAETYIRTSNLVCARNVNGTRCYAAARSLVGDACYFSGTVGICPASCAASLSQKLANAGCCLPLVNEYLRAASSSYAATYLPSGKQTVTLYNKTQLSFYFTAKYANSVLDRSQQPANAFAQCSNTSALWAQVETACPLSSSAIKRSIKIRLAWSQLASDVGKFKKFLESTRSDIANSIGADFSSLLNDTFTEDRTTSIKVSGSGSRRQSTTSSGTTYTFALDGSSASQSAAAFDTQSANGGITLTSTQAQASQSCSSCVDASGQVTASTDASTSSSTTPTPPTPAPFGGVGTSGASTWSVTVLLLLSAVLAVCA